MNKTTNIPASKLDQMFAVQRESFRFADVPTVKARRAILARFANTIRIAESDIIKAINDDFGSRATMETRLAEIAVTIAGIKYLSKRLGRLARPRNATHLLSAVPGRGTIKPTPKGVVGVISPWNYPFQLAALPAASALAAGNKVMIKPSEVTPRMSELLRTLIAQEFDEKDITVITGDVAVAQAFSALPFDHLFFTGSTSVGKQIAQTAAKNLTPVTLELGGKSPCVVMPDASIDQAAQMIAWGKSFNAGQTCVAPDYILVPRDQVDRLTNAILVRLELISNDPPNATEIISMRHFDRLTSMIEEAEARGAKVLMPPSSTPPPPDNKRFIPRLVLDPPLDCRVMQEEIFGPILPIIPYDDISEVITFINERDHPLALYVFGEDRNACWSVINQTTAGTVARNATLLQYSAEHLPFGGVGASGYGAYHGDAGFYTFSHLQPVFEFPGWTGLTKFITPPYGRVIRRMTDFTIGKPKR